jgi:hypothetical protein
MGTSVARKMGERTVEISREFLLNPKNTSRLFRAKDNFEFIRVLNSVTIKLQNCLHTNAGISQKEVPDRYWGSARKFLNIFLRDCLYNYLLRESYKLSRWEPWLEVPLDKQVAIGLRNEFERIFNVDVRLDLGLPRWHTIIDLSQTDSEIYQNMAYEIAERKHTYPVHLDLIYWNP